MKLCKICNNEKDGNHSSYCKSCNSKRVVEWKKANRERYNEYSRNLAKTLDKEKSKDSKKKWIANNKNKVKEYKDQWRSNNLDKYREYDRKRRAAKNKNISEKYSEKEVLELYGIICYICKKDLDLSAPRSVGKPGWENSLHIDHLLPISKGGPDTLENVRPSHALCNLKKSDHML